MEKRTDDSSEDLKTVLPEPTDPMLMGSEKAEEPAGHTEAEPPPENAEHPIGETTPKSTFKKPRFFPALKFGPDVDSYKGKLYISSTVVFNVNVKRQKHGFYAISGTISLIDPATGHLMQITGDRRQEFDKKRNEKELAPVTDRHAFQSAVKKELNIKHHDSENYTQEIKGEAVKIAQSLINQYRDLIADRTLTGVALDKLPLGLIYDGFCNAYLDDRTKSSDMRSQYSRKIQRVADAVGEIPLGAWSLSMLQRLEKKYPEINRDSINEVQGFLSYVAGHRRTANPAAACIQEYIDKKPKPKRNAKKAQQDAANAVFLPERVEKVLEQEAWNHLGDPRYFAYIMVKESGLNVEDLCALKIDNIQFGPEEEKAFIHLEKNYSNSATHDYTFPMIPSGTVYLRRYIDTLLDKSGEERIKSECYLISTDTQGKTQYSADEIKRIKDFFNEIIKNQKVGYAALAGLTNLTKESKGTYLLRETYENRIMNIFCGEGNLTSDGGAVTFMTHKSLINSVQSDHYRSFTDDTGKKYLYDSLTKDPRDPLRFLPTEDAKPYRRKSTKQLNKEQKIFTYPAKSGKGGQVMEVTLDGLKPGDIITIEALHGILVKAAKT